MDETPMRLTTSQASDASNARFPPDIRRQGRDEYLSVTENNHVWRTLLHKEHPIFIAIMTHIHSWARKLHIPMLPAAMPPREEQVTDGVNLLSVGQSDTELLISGC